VLFPKTTKAPFTTDSNTEENDGFWPNLEFATQCVQGRLVCSVGVSPTEVKNALYILTALICFRWLKHEEEESTTADEHPRDGYNIAGLLFFFLFLDNLFRHSRDQAGAASGRAQGQSRWWSCMLC
jgi:hypothetical protein